MERERKLEMLEKLNLLCDRTKLKSEVFLFAHCNATLELADELIDRGVIPTAILDNNPDKYCLSYKEIPVCAPDEVLKYPEAMVLIVSRFYEQMASQLRKLGYEGDVVKLVDYNPYSTYSKAPEIVCEKLERVKRGTYELSKLKKKYPGYFFVFCPFPALGDIYLCMSYLKYFLSERGRENCVVCVSNNGCKNVVELFGYTKAEVFCQKILDEMIQAVIYFDDPDCYIAHQDRPYVVDLHKALYLKCIPLENIYKCGVFGLDQNTAPVIPDKWVKCDCNDIPQGKTLIVSPYAKSVTSLPADLWKDIISDYKGRGYRVYTNVSEGEKELPGTYPLCAKLNEIKCIAEHAGVFVGIRSGLCDVLRTANCKKIALYPDYYYSDTRWKAIDMYALEEFENIVVGDDFRWQMN